MAIAGILELQLLADMARLSTDMKRAERVVQDSTDKMGRSVATLESAFGKLGSTLALGAAFDQVRRLTDDFTKLNAQIRIATRSQAEYAAGLADVRRISTAAQADINATAMLYTRITNSLREMGATQKQVSNITEAVSLGLKAYGATATEAASAMLQLSQAFGANRLGGEEFRAVSEAMPNMMQVLAKSMNVPLSALKNLSAEGKITRTEMMKAWDNPEVIASMRAQADQTRTITGEMTIFRNNLKMLVGEFMGASGSTSGITTALRGMSDGVLLLANHLAQVISLATTMAVLFAGKYLMAMQANWRITRDWTEAIAINTAHEKARAGVAAAASAQTAAAKQLEIYASREAFIAAQAETKALLAGTLAADARTVAEERMAAMTAKVAAAETEAIAIERALAIERAAATAAAEARAAAEVGALAKVANFAKGLVGGTLGVIGLALWGAYEVADHMGWIDKVFNTLEGRMKKAKAEAEGAAKLYGGDSSAANAANAYYAGAKAAHDEADAIAAKTAAMKEEKKTAGELGIAVKELWTVRGQSLALAAAEKELERARYLQQQEAKGAIFGLADVWGAYGRDVAAATEKVRGHKEALASLQTGLNSVDTSAAVAAFDKLRKAIQDATPTDKTAEEWGKLFTPKNEEKAADFAKLKLAHTQRLNLINQHDIEGLKLAGDNAEKLKALSKKSADERVQVEAEYQARLAVLNDKYKPKHALAPNVTTFGGMAIDMQARLEDGKAQESNVEKVAAAYKKMQDEQKAAGKDAQQLAAITHKYGTEAAHQAAVLAAQKLDEAIAQEKRDKAAKTAAEYAKEQIAKINVLEAARTGEMAFQASLQGKSKDDQEVLLAYHKENLRYEKEVSAIRNSSQFASKDAAVAAEMEKVLAAAKAAHVSIAASIEPTINEAHMNAELNKVRDNFKGVFDGLLEPGVNVFKKIADSFGAAVNKSIKDALDAALFGDMRDRLAKSVTDGMKPIITTIKDAKSKLDAWAIDVFGSMGGAAKGSDQAKQTGLAVSDAMVMASVALFSKLSKHPTVQQLNAVNQQYIQQWQGTGTVLGDASAKSMSIVTAMDTLNKTTFAHTDYLAQMTSSLRSVDKGMSSMLTELGKTLGVTGISQTPLGSSTNKVISDGLAMIGNVVGSFFGSSSFGSLVQDFFGSSSTTVTGTGINFSGTANQLQQGQGGSQYTSGVTTSSSLFGLVSDTSVWTQYSALNANVTKALGAVFVDIGKTIKAAAVALGGDAATLQKQLDEFVISTGNVSLAGMNVQQQQQALTNIVSQQSDLMVAAVVPSMKAFQVSGEGLLQTLVRVVSEIATLTEFNKALGDTAIVTAGAADKLITALGGVDAANQSMTKFVSNFAPETTKSALALSALEVALANAGLKGVAPLIKTTQDYFALMQVASADQKVVLLQQQDTALAYIKSIGSAMNLMLDQASKQASAAKNELGFVISNLSSLAGSLKGAAQSLYQSFMQQMTPDYQRRQYRASISQLQSAYDQYKATGVAPNAASLQQAVSNVSQGGTQMFTSALDWKRSTMQTIDLLSGMGNLADAQVTVLTQISSTMDKLLAAQQEQLAATNAGNTVAAKDAADRAAVLATNLQWLQGVNALITVSAKHNTLVIDLVAQTVTVATKMGSAVIDTLQKYITSGGTTMNGSGATTGAGGAFSSVGGSLPAGTAAGALNQVGGSAALGNFMSSGITTVPNPVGIPPDTLASLKTGSIAADQAAMAAMQKAKDDAAIAEIISTGNTALAALKKYWNTWPSNLPTDTANGDSLNSAMSAFNAVANANSGVAGAKAVIKSEATQFADFMRQYAPTKAYMGGAGAAYVNNATASYVAQAAALPSFAVGSNYIPKDMTANIHAGEEITPRPYVDLQRAARDEANALLSRLVTSNEAAQAELKVLRRDIADIRRTNQNMDWTTDKWDNEGMPEVRVS